jgi:MFS family permease
MKKLPTLCLPHHPLALFFQMMFVTGTFFSFIGPLLLGLVLDHYGPRVCSLISIALVAIGCFMFSISDVNNLRLFIPATSLIAFGGPGVQTAIIHLSNLFPLWKATATACITGCFQLSFVIFLIFDYLWENYQVPYNKLFLCYCFVCLFNACIAVFFWPDNPYHFEEEVEIYEKESHITHEEAEHLFVPVGKIRQPSVFVHHDQIPMMDTTSQIRNENMPTPSLFKGLKEAPLIEQVRCIPSYLFIHPITFSCNATLLFVTFLSQIRSPEFIRLTFFFLVNSFWLNFYIGTFDVQQKDSGIDTEELSVYARLFTLAITCGASTIPLAGALMDIYGFPATSVITIGCGFAWSALLLLQDRLALKFSFIFYAIYRTFFYTFVFAYLADVLGFKYFGVLAGIMFVIGGVLSLVQYPLAQVMAGSCHFEAETDVCDPGYWLYLNYFMAITVASTWYFSYMDWKNRMDLLAIHESSKNTLRKGSYSKLSGQELEFSKRGIETKPKQSLSSANAGNPNKYGSV